MKHDIRFLDPATRPRHGRKTAAASFRTPARSHDSITSSAPTSDKPTVYRRKEPSLRAEEKPAVPWTRSVEAPSRPTNFHPSAAADDSHSYPPPPPPPPLPPCDHHPLPEKEWQQHPSPPPPQPTSTQPTPSRRPSHQPRVLSLSNTNINTNIKINNHSNPPTPPQRPPPRHYQHPRSTRPYKPHTTNHNPPYMRKAREVGPQPPTPRPRRRGSCAISTSWLRRLSGRRWRC